MKAEKNKTKSKNKALSEGLLKDLLAKMSESDEYKNTNISKSTSYEQYI